MESLGADLRYAGRHLRRSPAFAFVIVALIGIGIAANTAIFTVVDALLLRKLPVRNPDDLVRIIEHRPPLPDSSYFPYDYWRLLRKHSTSFSEVIAGADTLCTAVVNGGTEFPHLKLVTENYFEVLGVKPARGRLVGGTDIQFAVLSHRYWTSRFHADSNAIGGVIQLNGHPFTIAGTTPPEFHGLTVEINPDVYVPAKAASLLIDLPTATLKDEQFFAFDLTARLKPEVSVERALAESMSLYDTAAREAARAVGKPVEEIRMLGQMQILRIGHGVSILRDQFATSLWLLMAGAGLVLLMVCSNVAGLLLERASMRKRETVVRLAVGATRPQLMRQWLTESLLLAALGGALGIALAWLALPALASMIPPLRNRGGELMTLDPQIALNWRVLVFSLGACVAAALIAGLAPAWRAGSHDLAQSLRMSRSSSPVEGGVTVLQIALCTLLLIQAGLFVSTLRSLRTMDAGFDREHVIALTLMRDRSSMDKSTFWTELLAQARQLPGAQAAGYARLGLMRGTGMKSTAGLPGQATPPSEFMNTSLNSISPEYFETMGMHITAGRGLERGDAAEGPQVPVVVNQVFAHRFFPNQDAVGRLFGTGQGIVKPGHQIVGVVSDAQYRSLREPIPPTFYGMITSSETDSSRILHIRSSGDPATLIAPVRELVRKLAPGWSIREVNMLRDEVERSLWRERLVAQLAGGFAVVAALLAAFGLYGTLAYYVARNRRAIGIRLAIGAAPTNIIGLLARRVIPLIAAGVTLGLAASLGLSSTVRTLLFGVTPTDPMALVMALAAVVLIAASAMLLPTWRAARIDPSITLREE